METADSTAGGWVLPGMAATWLRGKDAEAGLERRPHADKRLHLLPVHPHPQLTSVCQTLYSRRLPGLSKASGPAEVCMAQASCKARLRGKAQPKATCCRISVSQPRIQTPNTDKRVLNVFTGQSGISSSQLYMA